jgi:hypothetical protein
MTAIAFHRLFVAQIPRSMILGNGYPWPLAKRAKLEDVYITCN